MPGLIPYRRTTVMSRRSVSGFTLIELMVALVLGLLVALAAVAAVTVSRIGFTTVDASSQMRENARFTAELMQRIVVQAGYVDPSLSDDRATNDDSRFPGVRGYDNALLAAAPANDPTTAGSLANDSRTAGCGSVTDTSCKNFSDVLVINFQGSSGGLVSGPADGSMINCAGIAEPYVAGAVTAATPPRAYAAFHLIRTKDGEPSLACTYKDPTSGTWTTQTLVKGVESFQVEYGTDNVTSNTAMPFSSQGMLGAVDGYRNARDMVGPLGINGADTTNNWSRVRSLRISLLFRADAGSRSPRPSGPETLSLGMPSNGDQQTLQVQSQTDARLRQLMVFTVHLRNEQGYDLGCSATYIC